MLVIFRHVLLVLLRRAAATAELALMVPSRGSIGARARALGETRSPIERDLDFMRLAFSGIPVADYNVGGGDRVYHWIPVDCRYWLSADVELRCAVCMSRNYLVDQRPCAHTSSDGYVTAGALCDGGRYIFSARDRGQHVVPFPSAAGESSRMSADDTVVDMSGPPQSSTPRTRMVTEGVPVRSSHK